MTRLPILFASLSVLVGLGLTRLDSEGEVRTTALQPNPGERISVLQSELADLRAHLNTLSSQFQSLQLSAPHNRDEEFFARIDELDAEVLSRFSGLVQTVDATTHLAQGAVRDLDALSSRIPPSRRHLWKNMMSPTVQLASPMTVGTGVLLATTHCDSDESQVVHILTAWHVVRDILGEGDSADQLIPVRLYDEQGRAQDRHATLLEYKSELDTALLALNSPLESPIGAILPTRAELNSVGVFDSVYAIGCPLGSDPVPSHGELSARGHRIDGREYWMISAPTFIGNSGGGVFDATHQRLLGILSKLYTHGSRHVVVPHMGLVVPMTDIYDWFEACGYGELIPR